MIGPRLIFYIFLEKTKVMKLATLGQPVLILEPEILLLYSNALFFLSSLMTHLCRFLFSFYLSFLLPSFHPSFLCPFLSPILISFLLSSCNFLFKQHHSSPYLLTNLLHTP